MLTVVRTAPLLTVQDRGRVGYFAAGVTRSGGLDIRSLDIANVLVGNAATAAALEGCLGGAEFRCENPCTVAITGADVVMSARGAPLASYVAHTLAVGDVIRIERVTRGAVWYLAVAGGIDVPTVLGSRSTLLPAELGGIDGKPIKSGTRLVVGTERKRAPLLRPVPDTVRTSLDAARIPLAPGPRTDALTESDWTGFYATAFTVSRASSRVGYRLEGTPVPSRLAADLPSEPACAGAMQLPPEGNPIVLMADHPTIGGYPIVGVVPAHALGWLAQRVPGATVQFAPVSVDEAAASYRRAQDGLSNWASHD